MQRIKREITPEQYKRVIEEHITTGIFTPQELMGYGVYLERYFQDTDGKYYVEFDLGDSCD